NEVHVYSHDPSAELPSIWQELTSFGSEPLVAHDRPNDLIRIIYTGGTTGKPKGVMTLSSQLAFASLLHVAEQGFTSRTRMLVALPLTHGAGSFIIPTLYKGGRCVFHAGFNAERVLDAISRGEVTAAFFVPTVLITLMEHERSKSTSF